MKYAGSMMTKGHPPKKKARGLVKRISRESGLECVAGYLELTGGKTNAPMPVRLRQAAEQILEKRNKGAA